jgi:thiamine pyrophosphate-dependent acetolactate synthase large subunit-like protein
VDKNVKADAPVVGDAKAALRALLPLIKPADHKEWRAEFDAFDKEEYEKITLKDVFHDGDQIKMGEALAMMSDKTKGEAVIVTDVGQHQMVTAITDSKSKIRWSPLEVQEQWVSPYLRHLVRKLPCLIGKWLR